MGACSLDIPRKAGTHARECTLSGTLFDGRPATGVVRLSLCFTAAPPAPAVAAQATARALPPPPPLPPPLTVEAICHDKAHQYDATEIQALRSLGACGGGVGRESRAGRAQAMGMENGSDAAEWAVLHAHLLNLVALLSLSVCLSLSVSVCVCLCLCLCLCLSVCLTQDLSVESRVKEN